MRVSIVIFLSFFLVSSCVVKTPSVEDYPLNEAPYQEAKKSGAITNPLIQEASGLAASYGNLGVLWTINDSGNAPVLFAVSSTGQTVGEFSIGNTENRDWEDLASFRLNNENYLLIADVGDNYAKREYCQLYVVKEPDLDKLQSKKENILIPAWQMKFQYEDGPRDCESIAVDSERERILLLSKRTKPPVLYALPLKENPSGSTSMYIAKPIARLTKIPPPTREDLKDKYGKYRSQPTAMDLSDDGNVMVVLTYKNAYYYERHGKQTWKELFEQKPQRILLPHPNTGELLIREAICIDRRSGDLFVTTERIPAPIYQLKPLGNKANPGS